MNKMKRIFSFVLALAMLVGGLASVVAPAYAAEVEDKEVTKILKEVPKDIIGTEHEKAVRRLVAFGIVGGYPDGTYKPEENVTRSQFAKIIVEALGLADAVPAAQGKKTGFADVDQYVHWASGYIAVAAGEGLIKGYEDGLFRPEQPVSYAEALTMLVRALGYQDNFLAGQWPGNYVAKAASVGITRGVKIPADAGVTATRGYVADLVNNTLDAKVVKVNKYNPTIGQIEYEETDVTLLKDKLEISKHEDTRIFADKLVDDGLRKNEVEVRFLEDTRKPEEVRVTYKENDKKTFESEFNARPFIGEESTIYLTEKDVLVYVERENDDKANFDYVEEIDKDKVALVAFDKSYDFDKDADVYVFDTKDDEFKYMTGDDVKSADKDEMLGKVGKFVVRNNKIVYAEVYNSTEASPWMLVLKNDKGQLEGIKGTTEDFKLDLREDRNYDYVIAYDTEGNEVDVEDIEKGNLIYAQFQDYDGDDVAVVTVVRNNSVTGKLGKYRTDRVEIGGKTYKAIRYKDSGDKFQAFYTVDDLEEIKEWEDSKEFQDDMDDAYGEEVTAYLDATGKIAFLTTDVEAVSGYKYGIVTRTYADGDRVRIFTSLDGKEAKDQIFKADKERNISNPIVLNRDGEEKGSVENILGAAVKFRLNKDGEIDKDQFYVMDKEALWTMDADFGKDTMKLVAVENIDGDPKDGADKKSFAVSNNILMISADNVNPFKFKGQEKGDIEVLDQDIDIDDFDLVKWEDMKEDNKDQELRFYVFPKNKKDKEADGVVFVGAKGANTGSDEVAVYVINKDRKADEVEVKYDEFGANVASKIEDNADYLSDVVKEKAYVAKHKSNGKIELRFAKDKDKDEEKFVQDGKKDAQRFEHEDFVVYRNVIVKDTGAKFQIKEFGGKEFVYRNNPVTYYEDKIRDAKKGDLVDLIVEDDVRIRVVGINKLAKDVDGNEGGEGIKDGEYVYQGLTTIKGTDYILLKDSKGKDVEYPVTDAAKGQAREIEVGKTVEIKSRKVAGEEVVYKVTEVEDKLEELEVDSVTADTETVGGTVTVKFNRDVVEADKVTVQIDDQTAEDVKTGRTHTTTAKLVVGDNKIVVKADGKEIKTETITVKPDVKALETAITDAKEAKKDVKISKDGTDVEKTEEWVTEEVNDAFDEAIKEAEKVVESAKTDKDVSDAVSALNEAKSTYKEAKAIGIKG